MSTAIEHLDQLQREFNLVLEHTGRLFRASAKQEDGATIAQIARLKQTVPGATDRFHEALDALEDELRLAKSVFRRDLAVLREKEPKTQRSNAVNSVAADSNGEGLSSPKEVPHAKEPSVSSPAAADVAMEDAPDTEQSDLKNADESPHGTKPDSEPAPATAAHGISATLASDEQNADAVQSDTYQKPADGLHIDTQPEEDTHINDAATAEPDPETANTGTFDMDSLFGDPTSAGGAGALNNATLAPDDPASVPSHEFDFGSFHDSFGNGSAGEQNISTLLPGIGDYATTQPPGTGEIDFSTLDNVTADGHTAPNGGGDSDDQGAYRDSTFDDLMDFDDFNAGDYGGEHGEGGTDSNHDFFPQ